MFRGVPSHRQVFSSSTNTESREGACNKLENIKIVELISGDAHSIVRTGKNSSHHFETV